VEIGEIVVESYGKDTENEIRAINDCAAWSPWQGGDARGCRCGYEYRRGYREEKSSPV
jgi:hypothetical protein